MTCRFNGLTPRKAFRIGTCISCKGSFYLRDFTFRGSKCPMLLDCGHTICDYCVQQLIKVKKNSFTCKECNIKSPFLPLTGSNDSLSYHMFLLGQLLYIQYYKQTKESRLGILSKTENFLTYTFKGRERITAFCEECSSPASCFCENCRSNFCEMCWSKFHIYSKSLRKHSQIPINHREVMNFVKKCPQHESQLLEFFCEKCSKSVCSHCVILQHQGEDHCAITIKEKNLKIKEEVMAAAEEADNIEKRVNHSYEFLKRCDENPDFLDHRNYVELEKEISKNFAQLHGFLQIQEDNVIGQLYHNFKARDNSLRRTLYQLEKQTEKVASLMGEYRWAMKNPQCTDYVDLKERLMEIQNLPCHLVLNEGALRKPDADFDNSIVHMIRKYCECKFPLEELYDLRPESDLPEGYVMEPLKPSEEELRQKRAEELRRDTPSTSQEMTEMEFRPKVFHEKRSYSVRMAHIKNPGEFYVHLISQRVWLEKIKYDIVEFLRSPSEKPETVLKDTIYLVQRKVRSEWQRGRLVEVLKNRRINGEICMRIYFIDYGNSDVVPISRLRPASAHLLEVPPLAIKCKFFDCVPKDGTDWMPDAAKTMQEILKDYTASMYVMKIHRDGLEVDLSVIYPEGVIGRDLISVRDALMFLEFASFVRGCKIPRNASVMAYMNQLIPSVGDVFEGVLTHVNSASDFYVIKIESKNEGDFLIELCDELQSYYNENSDKNFMYNPIIGTPCVALFSEDNKWYRAIITDIPGDKKVAVYYVDFGNNEIVPWTSVRRLTETFIKIPPLALQCSLAEIIPKGSSWNLETKAYLEKMIMSDTCRVNVHSKMKSDSAKIKVLLYKKINNKEICVNNLFVDLGHAILPDPQNFNISDVLDREEIEMIEETESEIFPPFQQRSEGATKRGIMASGVERTGKWFRKERNFRRPKRAKYTGKELLQMHEAKKKHFRKDQQETFNKPAENEDDDHSDVFKVRVDVLSCETPSAVYVTFPSLKAELENLTKKMNEFYRNSTVKIDDKWKEGSSCAVFDMSTSCWYRGNVMEALPNNQVKLFLKDVAQIIVLPTSALRVLEPKFTKVATCCIKCHLVDVAPAGEEWPTITSEFLTSELMKYPEIFMTKKGKIENKSLPIELWVQKVMAKSALEPTIREWVTVNRLLVHHGLAIPTRPKMWEADPSLKQDFSDDEKDLMESIEALRTDDISNEKSSAFVPSPSCRWMPPDPLKRSSFTGVATYVDNSAVIYAYDYDQDHDKLELIRSTLIKEFENSKSTMENRVWGEGQLCIAKYHGDNAWYRGQIVKINENNSYEVLFVDYGNTETCHASDLREKIKMLDVPILSHKFVLQNIASVSEDEMWSGPVIDFIHSLVVDKKHTINILRHPLDPSEPHIASFKLVQENVDIGTYLIEQGVAILSFTGSDSSDSFGADWDLSISKKELMCGVEASKYIPLTIPENTVEFFVIVTFVENETVFHIRILDEESLSPSLREVLRNFGELQETMKEEGPKQPPLGNIKIGRPCCCLRSKTNTWSRGEVFSHIKDQSLVTVFYVDDGAKEVLLENNVHELKTDWLRVPKMALKCELRHVKRNSKVSRAVYLQSLNSCLRRTTYFAEIVNVSENCLEMKLYDKKNGRYAYQSMISSKLMKFVK